MRGPIGTDDARAVQREQHRQVLQRHVVDQLVIAALQERRIDREHRLQAFASQTSRECHRMLLGDADVEVPIRKTPLELDHAGALAHRGCDADQPLVLRRHVAEPLPNTCVKVCFGGVAGGTSPIAGSNLPGP